jgi:peptide/nickel transport system permease protein
VKLLARKLLTLVPVVLAVSFLTFLLTSLLPGDPARQVLGGGEPSAEQIEAVREDLGLNDPLPVRYGKWLGNALTGDLGRSYRTGESVVEAITERLPVTLEIGLLALVIALLVAIPVGILSALRAGTRLDRSITTATFGLLSVPSFVIALLLIYLFAVYLGVLPAVGWTRFSDDPVQNIRSAILPAMALSVGEMAAYSRLLRTDMIATLQQDFVTMAKAKGMPTWYILIRHALRPSSFSLLTVVGLRVAGLIGGAVIIETIFALPGIGRLLVDSIQQRDLIIVQGIVLFISVSYVLVNFVVDLLYAALDPRIRYG